MRKHAMKTDEKQGKFEGQPLRKQLRKEQNASCTGIYTRLLRRATR